MPPQESEIAGPLSFFELRRAWPEGYASVTIRAGAGSAAHHLDVYSRPCGEEFLKNFSVVPRASGPILDALPNNLGWIIVSPRCRGVFEGTGGEIDACAAPLGVSLSSACPAAIHEYALLSTKAVVDCLDLSSPGLTWDPSRRYLQKHEKLTLRLERIPPKTRFFSVPQVPLHIVSGSLRSALLAMGATGLSFRECSVTK